MTDSPEKPRTVRKPRRINSLYLFAALLLGLYFINYRPDIATVYCEQDLPTAQADVVMLATTWCPYCASARRYFHDNQIRYCEYDVERSQEGKRRYDALGGGGVPILLFGDQYRLNGFDERAIERALRLSNPRDDKLPQS